MSELLNLGPIDRAELDESEEALENIEANDEADPTPLSINVDTLPDGVTPTDFIDVFTNMSTNTNTGITYVSINDLNPGATYGASYSVATVSPDTPISAENVVIEEVEPVPELEPVVISEEPPRPEGQVYGPMTSEEVDRGSKENYLKKRQEKKEREEKALAKVILQNARRLLQCHENYFMTPNDLMIIRPTIYDRPHFIKTDTQRSGQIKNLTCVTNMCPQTANQAEVLTNGLIYDKNMNPLTVSYSPYRREKSDKRFSRIDIRNSRLGNYDNETKRTSWIVVDKEALMRSRGRDFRIKNRTGFTIQEALVVKKKIIEQFDKGEAFISYLKSMIGQIYDEENFEIIYEFGFRNSTSANMFHLYFQFPNLTITNSIELTHNIENFLTRLIGKHYTNERDKNVMKITDLLQGMRTTFSPEDMFYKYQHSHLPTGNSNWDSFCMGDTHFMSNISRGSDTITELEFETLLVAMFDHISWESLEGGPYMKMESIGDSNGGIINSTSNSRTIRAYSNALSQEIFSFISEINFTKLYDAFTLKTENGKKATYSFDRKLFITQFVNELDQDAIFNFHEEHELTPYVYIPSEDIFRRIDLELNVAGSWEHMYAEARKNVYKFPITYMNGKYIKPSLTNNKIPLIPIKKTLPTIHPDVILYVAKIIHFHLLNELKNVKT